MAKKYYWLKLQKDFFKRHDIRIIEDMPNGKDYILFYMKLLVESIDHEGHLRFSDSVPYNDSMLATITNTNIDIVRSAVKVFSELNLMEIMDDGTLYMSETNKMVGSVTDWAEKKRVYREKQKQIGQKKDMSDKSKSIELEKELEKEKYKKESRDFSEKMNASKGNLYDTIANYWNSKGNLPKALSSLSNPDAKRLCDTINEYGVDYVKRAIDNLSCRYATIEPKYRPRNLNRFLLNSVPNWADHEKASEEDLAEIAKNAESLIF